MYRLIRRLHSKVTGDKQFLVSVAKLQDDFSSIYHLYNKYVN